MARVKIDGMDDLEKSLKRLGKVPQVASNRAARSGAKIGLNATRKNAPEGESGQLAKGIIMKKERKVIAGKAVFDIMMDPAKNDIFVKESANGKRSYYPASMEYGFMTVDGGYVPGYRYFRRGLTENKIPIEKAMVESFAKEIDKAWNKRG